MHELVIFGVTGDLSRQKLIPALFNLYKSSSIPKNTSFIGFGRKQFSKHEFQNFIAEILSSKKVSQDGMVSIEQFSSQWSYVESELNSESGYKKLSSLLKTQATCVYVSLPPLFQIGVSIMLTKTGILSKKNQRKIIFEKPYGEDSTSAKKLNEFLLKKINETQIYRVDHYAGKESLVNLQKIHNLGLLQRVINSTQVSNVVIRFLESNNVSKRGAFYDSVGALSDVFQSHMLYMMAAILSQSCTEKSQGTIRRGNTSWDNSNDMYTEILKNFEVGKKVIGAQYSGYTKTEGVATDSTTETAFYIKGNISKKAKHHCHTLRGISVELIGGKGFKDTDVSIELVFKDKKKGSVKFPMVSPGQQDTSYEVVFMAAFNSNKERFPSYDFVLESWKLTEKIKKQLKGLKMTSYPLGTYPQDLF